MNKNLKSQATDLRELRGPLDLRAPILSVHLAHVPQVDDDLPARRHALLAQATAHGADDAAMKSLHEAFEDLAPGGPALAVFIGSDGKRCSFPLPGSDVEDRMLLADVPHLTPLLAWRQAHPAYVVALLDRAGADITVHPAGAGSPTTVSVVGPDDEIERNAPGGWSQSRFQQRAEDSWQHNARRDAEEVAAALDSSGARILLLGGDVRSVGYFTGQLPPWVRHEVAISRVSGSRAADGSWRRRSRQIAEQVGCAVDARTAELLAQVDEHGGPSGRDVRGASATLKALSQGRVRTLLLTARPDDRHTAWFGDEPAELAFRPTQMEGGGRARRHGPLADVAVRAALLTDADVWILPDSASEALPAGIGAVCRF